MTMRASATAPEGTWFAVPLLNGGYAIGLVARTNGRGTVLAYFFGPRLAAVPPLETVSLHKPSDAILVTPVGDYAFRHASWPLIGKEPTWRRESWPTPPLARYEELTGRWFEERFDDEDPAVLVSQRQIDQETGRTLPRSRLMGSGSAEQALTKLLGRSN